MTEFNRLRRFINNNIRTDERFPSLSDICSALNYSEEQARKYMESLAEDGYIEKVGSWFRFPNKTIEEVAGDFVERLKTTPNPHTNLYDDNGEIAADAAVDEFIPIYARDGDILRVHDIAEPVKRGRGRPAGTFRKNIPQPLVEPQQASPEPRREVEKAPVYKNQVRIIQAVMAFIGTSATIISVYYSSIWMLEFLPAVLAILLSLIMVGFSVFAFEIVILFFTGSITDNKFIKIAVATGFTLLWIVATSFSIFSTVAGQVNKDFQKKEAVVAAVDHNSQEYWQILQDQKSEAKETLKDYRQQIQTYNQILSGLNSAKARLNNKQAWNDSTYKLQQAQKNVSKISEELENIRIQEKKILADNRGKGSIIPKKTEQNVDLYTWLAKILGIDPDKIQFFMALSPAIFCDLIAPFGLATALFLRNK